MGLSGTHMFLLLIIGLVIFGPSRLPKLGRSFGDAVRAFKKGLHGDEIDVTDSVRHEPLAPPSAAPLFREGLEAPRAQSAPAQNQAATEAVNRTSAQNSNGGSTPNRK